MSGKYKLRNQNTFLDGLKLPVKLYPSKALSISEPGKRHLPSKSKIKLKENKQCLLEGEDFCASSKIS